MGIFDCFFDSQTITLTNGVGGGDASSGVTAKTTAEMMKKATFTAWDFTSVWNICEDNSYPSLQWQNVDC